MLDKVYELAQTLKALLPMKLEHQQKLDKKFRLEFNYNSNHMEGNTLTYGETELLLLFNETNGNHTLREYEEMKGHDLANNLILEFAADKEHPLTESFIKNLNQVMLKEPFWKEAITSDGQDTRRLIKVGNYKEHPNSVRLQNGEIFNYASPAETPILMQEMIDWYRVEEASLHPVTLAAMLHYRFVRIHPFDDGNGRIARLLMNYALLKNELPPVIIKSNDKQNYLRALHLADVGNHEPFIDYIAKQVVWSLEVYIKAAKGESIEELDDWNKELILLKKDRSSQKNFSAELSNTIKNEIYFTFIEKLINKFSSFDDLFFSKKYSFKYDKFYDEIYNPEQIKKLSLAFWDYKSIANSISFRLTYEKMKEAINAPDYQLDINLRFNLYFYAIELPIEEVVIEKPYGQKISDEKTEEAISIAAKNLLHFIRVNLPK